MNSSFFASASGITSNQVFCTVEGDNIYSYNSVGAPYLLGKSLEEYNKVVATAEEYYNKLVEKKILTPEKTVEEKQIEMQQAMASMVDVLKSLQDEIKELKGKGHSQDSKPSDSGVSELGSSPEATGSHP